MKLPPFSLGNHFRELRGGENRFCLVRDVSMVIPQLTAMGHKGRVSFRDYRDVEWARIEGDVLTIRLGYAWNGASPKRWFLGRWWGTPDFPETILATLFHDVCFQFLRTRYWPLTIAECNDLFHAIMTASGFRFANTYLGAVTDFGELFAGKYPRRGEYSILLPDLP